jgi:ABC-type sugar transport system substrate-binding protein
MTIRVFMPLQGNIMSKVFVAALVSALLLCAGCSGMAGSSSSGGSSGITVYGTIDEGVTIRK